MKKNFLYVLLCLFVAGFFIVNLGQASKDTEDSCKIYFVDRQLHRLIPTPFSSFKTPEKTAKKMVAAIIDGKDSNPEILRLIPNTEGCITVQVLQNTAYVNLSGELSNHINKNAETERLFVYQLVNSLTSIDGIDYVRFTIDEQVEKEFLGFLDMREIFTVDYYM